MRKLTKHPEPTELAKNKIAWTQEYVQLHSSGQPIPDRLVTKYKLPAIRRAIELETSKKCAYCESKVLHISFGDIDHILPKSIHSDLVFEWTNLTLSCTKCNHEKLNYDSGTLPMLHPYKDEPDEHLSAAGPFLFAINGSSKGKATILTIKLNRADLMEKRTEKLNSINSLIEQWASETDADKKAILQRQLDEETKPEMEFSFVVRNYVKQRCRT